MTTRWKSDGAHTNPSDRAVPATAVMTRRAPSLTCGTSTQPTRSPGSESDLLYE